MDGYRVTTGSATLPDGQWVVVNRDGERWEFPIAAATPDEATGLLNSIADMILNLDGDDLWQRALDGADMATSPTSRLLELIADAIRP